MRLYKFLMLLIAVCSINVFAESGSTKKVKVGYYEDHNFQVGAADSLVKKGYSFEYLQRLQMYTDWEYEYVYGNFSEMYNALVKGDVDILTGLGFKEDRAKLFSYPTLAMGQTLYSLIKKQERTDITTDPKSLAGKKIGALDGPMLVALRQYLTENGVEARIVVYADLYERDHALMDGSVDAVILESSATSAIEQIESFAEVGANNYYVCVAKNRPDLLKEINKAQGEMFRSKPHLKEELYNKWLRHNVQSAALSEKEKQWVKNHSEFRVGYYTSYLPYSGTDENGNATGVLTDVVPELFRVLAIDEVRPVYKGYDSFDEMTAALESGEIDVLFPVYSEFWTAEKFEITPTDGIISGYYNLVYRDQYPDMKTAKLALRKSNKLVQAFVMMQYPQIEIELYDSVRECLEAVVKGDADATLINGLRTPSYMHYDKTYQALHFSQIAGSVPLGFGAKRNESAVVELLNHAISIVDPDFALNQTHLYEHRYQMSALDFIRLNWWIAAVPIMVIIFTGFVFAFIELKRNKKTLLQEAEHNKELTEKIRVISELKLEADAANKAKTDFLFSMSHDIRTPMNASIGFTDLLEKNLENPDKSKNYIKKIKDANSLLLSIINNVLEMSRIESGSVSVEEIVYASELFNDALNSIFEEMMAQKDITFSRSIDIKHRFVYCDPIKLREIFVNIIGNAYKYTNPGGTVHMDLKEIPCDREGWVLYQTTISDTGIGIDEEFLPHIFDPFSRERNSTETKIEGTGLGLSIVKRLVELLDGTIDVKSKKGEGSVFIITIPHRIAQKEDLTVTGNVDYSKKHFKGRRILLAEDNELNAEIACEILREAGFEIDCAVNGKECVEMLQKSPDGYYDLVLMDIQMPEMNGYEATRAIRKLTDSKKALIPVVAMTANAFEEDRRNAFAAGMNGHIAKPLNLDDLFRQLAAVLK